MEGEVIGEVSEAEDISASVKSEDMSVEAKLWTDIRAVRVRGVSGSVL